MSMRESLHSLDFKREVLESSIPVLVDFQAPWCEPCALMSPVIKELGREYKGKIKTVTIDVDQESALADQYAINSIPTLLVFKDGQVVRQRVGAAPLNVILALIKDLF